MIVLELFSGTGSIARAFREQGHQVLTIDNNPDLKPDLCMDILQFNSKVIPEPFNHPDVIWASPPCTTFSVASISHYWKDGKPKKAETYIGLALAMKALDIIYELKPKYWFLENPRGMLRQQFFMKSIHRKTISYCQYGLNYQKPTDIWTNAVEWIPKPMCSPRSPCHEASPRGSKTGTQGLHGGGVQ